MTTRSVRTVFVAFLMVAGLVLGAAAPADAHATAAQIGGSRFDVSAISRSADRTAMTAHRASGRGALPLQRDQHLFAL
jgi:hypothetical protein